MDEKNIIDFVKKELACDHSGHDHLHALRVANIAKQIMEKEDGCRDVVIPAAYLHDCIDHKLFSDIENQRMKVNEFLLNNHFNDPQREEILFIMDNISYSSGKSHLLQNRNAQIVCDADRLDALGAMGIIRTIEFGASRNRKFYVSEEDVKAGLDGHYELITKESSLAHFYEKLLKLEDLMFTQTAQQMAKERTVFMRSFLTEFYKEASFAIKSQD